MVAHVEHRYDAAFAAQIQKSKTIIKGKYIWLNTDIKAFHDMLSTHIHYQHFIVSCAGYESELTIGCDQQSVITTCAWQRISRNHPVRYRVYLHQLIICLIISVN